jgi:hypothetical protein
VDRLDSHGFRAVNLVARQSLRQSDYLRWDLRRAALLHPDSLSSGHSRPFPTSVQ